MMIAMADPHDTASRLRTQRYREQEALDDFAQTMGSLRRTASQASLLAVKIEALIEQRRKSDPPEVQDGEPVPVGA